MKATASFNSISEQYNDLWHFSTEYERWMDRNIIELLGLDSKSIFGDLGGGTGSVTNRLREACRMDVALCVDPALLMLKKEPINDHLIKLCQSAEDFAKEPEGELTHILIKEAIHHFENRAQFWQNIKANQPQAKILVVTRPQRPGFVLFEACYERFALKQPDINTLIDEARQAGFNARWQACAWSVSMPKDRWYNMIRARFMSDLFAFTNEQIEQGIEEIDAKFSGEIIEFQDTILFMVAEPSTLK